MKKNNGFTLIELLIALGLMAIFALLAYRGLDSVLRLNSAAQAHDAQAAARLRVMVQLETDLRQAQQVSLNTATLANPAAQTLQLKRRTLNAEGGYVMSAVTWSVSEGNLNRRVQVKNQGQNQAQEQEQAQVATLLEQVTRISWLTHQSTPIPMSTPWAPAAAQAGASDLELRRAVMLQLTQQGQTFEKAFVIGR